MDEFFQQGHETVVLTPTDGEVPSDKVENGYRVVRSISKKIFAVKGLKKALGVFTLSYYFKKTIKNKFKAGDFDLVVMHTPFIASYGLNKFLKSYLKCKTHLIVWDLFPQNAVDIGLIKKSVLTNYLFQKQNKLLNQVDFLSCMSKGNRDYLVEKHMVSSEKIGIIYNWGTKNPNSALVNKKDRKDYGFNQDDFILLFGGNQGLPQRLEYMIHLAQDLKTDIDIKIVFVGGGTENAWLQSQVDQYDLKNVSILPQVSRVEYLSIASMCDIGLVSLDERFTVPNFPSKTTDYFSSGLPVVAHVDSVAHNDYGEFLSNITKSGISTIAGERSSLIKAVLSLKSDPNRRKSMSEYGKVFFKENLSVKNAYSKLCELWKLSTPSNYL